MSAALPAPAYLVPPANAALTLKPASPAPVPVTVYSVWLAGAPGQVTAPEMLADTFGIVRSLDDALWKPVALSNRAAAPIGCEPDYRHQHAQGCDV
jgi:hypothetical protein